MHASKLAELTAEVNAVNLANGYANELLPKLVEFFTPLVGQKIVKADGSLLAKLESKLPVFPAEKGRPGQHVHASVMTYRHRSDYSLAWTVKVCWPIPPHTCTYYERTLYVGDMSGDTLKEMTKHLEPWRTDYTVEAAVAKIEAYEAAKKAADDARSECWPFEKFIR